MNTKYILLTVLILTLLSCGQDAKNSKDQDGPRQDQNRNIDPNLSEFVKNQRLDCGETSCPEYLAKIVIISDGKPTYCAGTLVNSNTIVTSSSCIPRAVRIRGKYCSEEIFAVFGGAQTEIIPCQQIIELDNKISFLEPAMWKGDYLFFNLIKETKRTPPRLAENGIVNRDSLDLWRVDFENQFLSVIRKSNCLAVHNSYLNPFVESSAHPMQVVSGCESKVGSLGSPLINKSGELVGTLSQEMSGNLYNFLNNSNVLAGELSHYHHVTNISCLDFLGQPMDPNRCNPNLSLYRLDALRADVLRGTTVNHTEMTTVSRELSELGRYFKWEFEFKKRAWSGVYELAVRRPVCIRDTDVWIGEFTTRTNRIYNRGTRTIEVPNFNFVSKLDSNLQPTSILEEKGTKAFTFTFNPWSSRVQNETFVDLSYNLFGQQVQDEFKNIKPCP
ncbi:MAG: hypothetical protein CME65_03565 [Halobacteriovoraceae bacterium]|nr:hypothetical protein [Halobacteriovoraceae bacterium]